MRPGRRPWWYRPVGNLFDQFLGAAETDPVLAEWFLRRFSLLDSLYMVPAAGARCPRHSAQHAVVARRAPPSPRPPPGHPIGGAALTLRRSSASLRSASSPRGWGCPHCLVSRRGSQAHGGPEYLGRFMGDQPDGPVVGSHPGGGAPGELQQPGLSAHRRRTLSAQQDLGTLSRGATARRLRGRVGRHRGSASMRQTRRWGCHRSARVHPGASAGAVETRWWG